MVEITLVPYDPAWPPQFHEVGSTLRESLAPVLGEALTRIDHIGSTAVPGLAAKPVIDVQVSVRDFTPEHADSMALPAAVESLGIMWHRDWPFDRRKWVFSRRQPYAPGPLGAYDVNVHVRREGCVSQQQALLFRDYLRANAAALQRYEAVKQELARRQWPAVNDYAEAKGDCVWAILREADAWSTNGWRPGPSDA